jgi:hypothetical protein
VERFVHLLADGVRRFGGILDRSGVSHGREVTLLPIVAFSTRGRRWWAGWGRTCTYAEELRLSEGVDLHVRIGR